MSINIRRWKAFFNELREELHQFIFVDFVNDWNALNGYMRGSRRNDSTPKFDPEWIQAQQKMLTYPANAPDSLRKRISEPLVVEDIK